MRAMKVVKGIRHPAVATRYVTRSVRESALKSALEYYYGDNKGPYILDKDWDNLIILDACRYDVFRKANNISGDLRCVRSRGTVTSEFIRENFANREAHDTIYISGNAMVGSHKEHIDVFKLIGMWTRNTNLNSPEDSTDPRSLMDPQPTVNKALNVHEKYPNKRLIVHLLPPHTPFLVKDGESLPEDSPYRTYTAVRKGKVSADVMRDVYLENVEFGLGYAKELVKKLDGKSVITSDHGELLGEGIPFPVRVLDKRWNFANHGYYDWAHYGGIREPELMNVPWLVIEGDKRRTIQSEPESAGIDMDESTIESQLEALGYK